VMLVGFFGCRLFLTWMGTPLNVIDLSTVYMRIYFLGMPACMVYNFGASILRSIGDTKRPMYFLVIAGIVNVVLNLILVIVFHLSVAGVAIATAVSQVVSAVLVVRCLMKQTNACRFSIREMRIYPDHLRTIMRIGLPAGLQSSLFNLSNVFIQSSINSFGSIAMEGNTAASNLEGFIYISMNAFYHAALTFVGQNIGARQYHRIRRIVFSCIGLVCAVGMAMGFLIYSLREPLLMIYTKDSLDMIPYGVERMQCIATTYFLCGIMEVLVGAVRGMGASFVPMINSLIGACAFRVVWICTVFAAYRNLQVLYLSWPASWILTILLQGVAFAVIYHRFMKRHGTALAE